MDYFATFETVVEENINLLRHLLGVISETGDVYLLDLSLGWDLYL